MQAITSAGIVYSIARACSRDQIVQCSCDNTYRSPPEDGDFQWGGCGDNLEHGYNYARRLSAQALTNDASSLLNEHNSEAGRLVSCYDNFLIDCSQIHWAPNKRLALVSFWLCPKSMPSNRACYCSTFSHY